MKLNPEYSSPKLTTLWCFHVISWRFIHFKYDLAQISLITICVPNLTFIWLLYQRWWRVVESLTVPFPLWNVWEGLIGSKSVKVNEQVINNKHGSRDERINKQTPLELSDWTYSNGEIGEICNKNNFLKTIIAETYSYCWCVICVVSAPGWLAVQSSVVWDIG